MIAAIFLFYHVTYYEIRGDMSITSVLTVYQETTTQIEKCMFRQLLGKYSKKRVCGQHF